MNLSITQTFYCVLLNREQTATVELTLPLHLQEEMEPLYKYCGSQRTRVFHQLGGGDVVVYMVAHVSSCCTLGLS